MAPVLIIILICLVAYIGYIVCIREKEDGDIELNIPIAPATTYIESIAHAEWSEHQVISELLSMGIDPRAIFHNLYIQKQNGEYAQIDVAVTTKVGIIVFEVKDYSGWIFGNEHQRYWTKILAYGKEKHRFYNPIIQNAGHIQAIRQRLTQNPGIPIYSVVVFFGNSEFKNVTCNVCNTFIIYPHDIRRVVSEILMQPNANFGNKYEIMDLFTKGVQNGTNPMIVSSHIHTAAYYSRNTPASAYTISYNPFSGIGRFRYRRRFRR